MTEILEGRKDLLQAGQNGRQYFLRHYTLEQHIAALEQQLQQLADQNRRDQ